jgi:hypothetical protein
LPVCWFGRVFFAEAADGASKPSNEQTIKLVTISYFRPT